MSQDERTGKDKQTRENVEGLVEALRFNFPEEGVVATARLLHKEAPRTCDVIVAALPHEGDAIHGEYSGPEILTLMPGRIHAPAENCSVDVHERDVGFLRFRGGTDLSSADRVTSEIAWFYGDNAVPSMRDGPVDLNIFARFEEQGWQAFKQLCAELEPGQSRHLTIKPLRHYGQNDSR